MVLTRAPGVSSLPRGQQKAHSPLALSGQRTQSPIVIIISMVLWVLQGMVHTNSTWLTNTNCQICQAVTTLLVGVGTAKGHNKFGQIVLTLPFREVVQVLLRLRLRHQRQHRCQCQYLRQVRFPQTNATSMSLSVQSVVSMAHSRLIVKNQGVAGSPRVREAILHGVSILLNLRWRSERQHSK